MRLNPEVTFGKRKSKVINTTYTLIYAINQLANMYRDDSNVTKSGNETPITVSRRQGNTLA